MKTLYDDIGINYSGKRRTDPRIAAQIYAKLNDAERIVNIGAGTGSYEPEGHDLIAVEPSAEMIAQRSDNAYPVVQAYAEELPFENDSFTHAMTIFSMHHWVDQGKAFKEINRVVTDRFVAVTWNPAAEPFWLTRDYFPEIYEEDCTIFPSREMLEQYFDEVEVIPLMVPEDVIDGFLAAHWKRPQAYLIPEVRQSMSGLAKLKDPLAGLRKLKNDLDSGAWKSRNEAILNEKELDVGYAIISAKVRKV